MGSASGRRGAGVSRKAIGWRWRSSCPAAPAGLLPRWQLPALPGDRLAGARAVPALRQHAADRLPRTVGGQAEYLYLHRGRSFTIATTWTPSLAALFVPLGTGALGEPGGCALRVGETAVVIARASHAWAA